MSVLPRVLDVVADRTVVPGYTKLGFLLRKPFRQPLRPDALCGKQVMIIGANSGSGEATSTELDVLAQLWGRQLEDDEGVREAHTGHFWHDRAPRPAHYLRRTRETATQRDALWKFSEERTRR